MIVDELRPTLGVVGGMGPLAGVKFVENLLASTPVDSERDHLRVLLDNDPLIPDRLTAYRGTGVSPAGAIQARIEGLARLGVTAVAVPCNAVHYFRREIADVLPVPWLDMIAMVGRSVARRSSRPLILGAFITVQESLYTPYLPGCTYPGPELNSEIFRAIDAIKSFQIGSDPTESCAEVARLRSLIESQDCDAVVLACTELTVIRDLPGLRVPVIDSSLEYARLVSEALRDPLAHGLLGDCGLPPQSANAHTPFDQSFHQPVVRW
ncbi:aspartate/glutamate racemase family protein [Burkholderia sp. D-99]|uniref:aspartate/glutamate racemase family protein n=1 Tax=Burkholderia sp. D-99 TaxID=2717316 RepID=UPI0014237C27|nr:aspartate/glutamate racemase family protein [Burkholderia sp. D-99]NHV28059.1 aspartate/glutamate racemase family protein [Burkholderia sp. D-99]